MKQTFYPLIIKTPSNTSVNRGHSGSSSESKTQEENALDTTSFLIILSILQFDLSNFQCWHRMKKKTCGAVRSIFAMRAMRCGLAAKKRFYFFAT
jgi:hypothetical protein